MEKGHQTVCAEVYGKFNKEEDFVPKVVAKSEEQNTRIRKRLSQAFMFSCLDEKEINIIINAMEERSYKSPFSPFYL